MGKKYTERIIEEDKSLLDNLFEVVPYFALAGTFFILYNVIPYYYLILYNVIDHY